MTAGTAEPRLKMDKRGSKQQRLTSKKRITRHISSDDHSFIDEHSLINELRNALQVTLKMSFPLMGDQEDLRSKKKSLVDQFQYVVQTYKERFDTEKADLFLQNVLHAVSLSRDAVERSSSGRSKRKKHQKHPQHLREPSVPPYDKRLVVVAGVVLASLLLLTVMMIVAIASDRRAGGGGGGRSGFSSVICGRLCTRCFRPVVGRKSAAARPLPPLPTVARIELPHATTGRIELPPSINSQFV